MAKLNMKPHQKSDRIAGQMEDFLLDPEFEFEVVEPEGTNPWLLKKPIMTEAKVEQEANDKYRQWKTG